VEWLLALLAAGTGAGALRYAVIRRRAARDADQELDAVRRLAEEDVTVFGEQLQRLDERVGGSELDPDARADYQRALNAYESAERAIHHLRRPDEVSTVTDTLSTGRYAIACVQARAAHRDLPELRTPCFFNPQHGPSVTDVEWTTARYGTRVVPACAQDAARVAAHGKPEVRMAQVGARRVPYWEAGDAFLPYSEGYFPAGTFMAVWAADAAVSGHGWDPAGGGDFFGIDPGGDVGGGGGDVGF
jgi:hypothetical protein